MKAKHNFAATFPAKSGISGREFCVPHWLLSALKAIFKHMCLFLNQKLFFCTVRARFILNCILFELNLLYKDFSL
jgi:hypothetical protein